MTTSLPTQGISCFNGYNMPRSLAARVTVFSD